MQYILKILSKATLWRYQPLVVAVTGSVGKTSTKEAIYQVLKKRFRVRRNIGNYNNEIGIPLTVLGLESGDRSLFSWIKNFLKAFWLIFWRRGYPEILVLEMGVDRPGDMRYLLNFIPVRVGVITAIGQFPSHIEFFLERDQLVNEKALLVESLEKDGLAVLNCDDLSVREIGENLSFKTNLIFYGFSQLADLMISNYELDIDDFRNGHYGINFKLEYKGSIVPVRLTQVLGKQNVFAAAAAAGVGLFFGLNLVDIAGALSKYRSLPGRTKIIKGVKKTWIIDDSYNSSPLAAVAALELLEELGSVLGGRRIAVLGDMLELGADTEAGHRQVGQKAVLSADLLFTVGDRAGFIADEAIKNGMPKERIFQFSYPEEVGLPLQGKIKKEDIILVKGSRAMKMEKIVKEIMAFPQKADKLLINN